MIFWASAFLLGFFGSFHCAFMCGPIAIALPGQNHFKRQLIYNLGRIVSYLGLGMVIGLLGQGLYMAGLQQSVSILSGVLLLAFYFIPKSPGLKRIFRWPISIYSARLRQYTSNFLGSNSLASRFFVGIFNGLLPCGLVYVAIAAAIASGSPLRGITYMFLFGLGTLPMMMGISFTLQKWLQPVRYKWSKLTSVFIIMVGVLFIARGMNLGIKYISPDLSPQQTKEITICSS